MKLFLLILLIQQSVFAQPSASRFILSVAHYEQPDLDTLVNRCIASVITERHVLTTATCVDVEPSQGVAVVAEVTAGNYSENSKACEVF